MSGLLAGVRDDLARRGVDTPTPAEIAVSVQRVQHGETDLRIVDDVRSLAREFSGLGELAVPLADPEVTDVRGLGLMLGNEFRDAGGNPDGAAAGRAQQEAARRGLLLLTCGAWGQVVRFIPALVVNEAQVDEAAQLWRDTLAATL